MYICDLSKGGEMQKNKPEPLTIETQVSCAVPL